MLPGKFLSTRCVSRRRKNSACTKRIQPKGRDRKKKPHSFCGAFFLGLAGRTGANHPASGPNAKWVRWVMLPGLDGGRS